MTGRAQLTAMARLLRSSTRGHARDLRRVFAWSLVQALPALLSGLLIARAIDHGFLAGRTLTGLAWLGVYGLSVLAGGWATRQTFMHLARIVEPFRDELVERTVRGSLRRSTATGAPPDTAAVARITRQVEIVREAYASVLLVVQGFLVASVGALVGLAVLDPRTLLLVAPPLLAGIVLFALALPGMARRQRASILADEQIADSAALVAGAMRDVEACGAERAVESMLDSRIDAQARATREIAGFTAVRTVAVGVGGLLPMLLILGAGSWLVAHGASTGVILGAITYVVQGVHPAVQTLVRGLGHTGLWLFVTLTRIVEETEVSDVGAVARASFTGNEVAATGHEILLREVTFGYGRVSEPVLAGLSLTIGDGDHLAVVGPSGAGKSTLAALVAGLLEPQRGQVLLGGTPAAGLGATAARRRTLIPQEAYVFAGTLRENLAYLAPDVPDRTLADAAERLGTGALVERLGNLDAVLDPHDLSAGERQLLALVRSYVSPAPVVILDEATCHLDPAAEARVERAFAERPGTLIVIAHRISSAMRARRVLVLDAGQAVLGSHDHLLARSPLYRELVGRWGAAPAARPRPHGGWALAARVSALAVSSMRRLAGVP